MGLSDQVVLMKQAVIRILVGASLMLLSIAMKLDRVYSTMLVHTIFEQEKEEDEKE